MRNWQLRHIALVWLGWTALLVISGYAYAHSTLASGNVALPLPSMVTVYGHGLGATGAMIFAIASLMLLLYLPPILLTLSWLVARRRQVAR
jgi:hypothetical protein